MIAINSVPVHNADEFEEWLRSLVVPAMKDQRPDLDGQWRVLRATEADRALEQFADMLRGDQDAWFFTPVALDRA